MAGDWLKIESNTPEKAEVLVITARMGWDDPDLTVGKLFRLWRWFDQQTTDGNAHSVTSALLDRVVGVSGFCDALQAVGWLAVTDDGISLPKFDRHNGNTAKNRALTAKRVAMHKSNAAGNAEGNAPSVSGALPREEKRREEEKDLERGEPIGADTRGHEPTKAGLACKAMRAKGMQAVNPGDPRLTALIAQGATVDEFESVAEDAVAKGKGWAWALVALQGRRTEAAAIQLAPKPDQVAASAEVDRTAAYLAEQREHAAAAMTPEARRRAQEALARLKQGVGIGRQH